MATNKFDLTKLYTSVFGLNGVRFAIPNSQERQGGYDFSALQLSDQPQARASSVLGTPIYEQITVIGEGVNYTFPDWPLIDISYPKTIVKTPILNGKGTVKEYINTDDYQVNIRGILINYFSDAYPEDLLYEFEQVCKINKELRILSPVVNLLDINNIVIENVSYPSVEGFNNIQPFVLQCVSDEPVELVIKQAKNQSKIKPGL